MKASLYSDWKIEKKSKPSGLLLKRRLSQSAFGLDRDPGKEINDFKLERIDTRTRTGTRTGSDGIRTGSDGTRTGNDGTRTGSGGEGLKVYVRETLPKISSKIKAIHAAVSCGDISCLEDQVEE